LGEREKAAALTRQESGLGRHYGMDWLRIGAFALLIFYHIGMVFIPWAYHAKVAHPIGWVTIPMQALNAWRLALLFVVSGFASRAIFAGAPFAGRFAWGRIKRLLPPILFAMVVINPAQPWVELTTQHGYTGDFWHFLTTDYFRFQKINRIVLPNWQHLWFVVYLWAYTLGLALVLFVIPTRLQTMIERVVSYALTGPLLLIVPVALLIGQWLWTYPGTGETHAFFDDLPAHRLYFAMFLFGFLLAGNDRLWRAIRRWWPLAAGIALTAYTIVAVTEFTYLKIPITGKVWYWFGMVRAVQTWTSIIALIGIADRWLNHDHPSRAMLNEAVFPFYIIHQTIIVVVAGALLQTSIGPLAEFAVLLAATVLGCWVFYRIGREIGWLRPLIGLRARRATASAKARPSGSQ